MNVVKVSDSIVMYRCRLCLKVSMNVVDVFKQDFPKMIKLLTTLEVSRTDNLPKVACTTCARAVKDAMNLRKQIILSYRTLKKEAQDKALQAAKITPVRIQPEPATESQEIISLIVSSDSEHNADTNDQSVFLKEECIDVNEDGIVKSEAKTEKSLQLPMNNEISIIQLGNIKKESPKVDAPRPIKKLVTSNQKVAATNKKKMVYRVVPNLDFLNQTKNLPKPRTTVTRPYVPTPCKICQKVVLNCNMKKHMEVHDRKLHNCPICGKVSISSSSLRSHIFYFHKCKADQYVCDQCGRNFRYRQKFKLHMKKEHGGERDVECKQCGKKFFETRMLNKHVMVYHNKVKAYVCDYCGRSFGHSYSLRVHLRQHMESYPYSCDACGEKYKQKVSLKTHQRQAHGIFEEENVFCEECGKGFASNIALRSHINRLHLRKKCSFCTEVFVSDEYLQKHISEKHESAEGIVT